MIVAHELGCADRIKKVGAAAHPVQRDAALIAHNPLGQLPALLLDDGTMLAGALLARYETAARPSDKQWSAWLDGQLDKSRTGLAAIEKSIARYRDRFDIGTITIA